MLIGSRRGEPMLASARERNVGDKQARTCKRWLCYGLRAAREGLPIQGQGSANPAPQWAMRPNGSTGHITVRSDDNGNLAIPNRDP